MILARQWLGDKPVNELPYNCVRGVPLNLPHKEETIPEGRSHA